MRAEERAQQSEATISMMELVCSPTLRQPLIISVVMQLSQQLSGINAVSISLMLRRWRNSDRRPRNRRLKTLLRDYQFIPVVLDLFFDPTPLPPSPPLANRKPRGNQFKRKL